MASCHKTLPRNVEDGLGCIHQTRSLIQSARDHSPRAAPAQAALSRGTSLLTTSADCQVCLRLIVSLKRAGWWLDFVSDAPSSLVTIDGERSTIPQGLVREWNTVVDPESATPLRSGCRKSGLEPESCASSGRAMRRSEAQIACCAHAFLAKWFRSLRECCTSLAWSAMFRVGNSREMQRHGVFVAWPSTDFPTQVDDNLGDRGVDDAPIGLQRESPARTL